MSPRIRRVMIAVITYKRSVTLSRLLASISASDTQVRWRVAVVDNDPMGSAEAQILALDDRFSYYKEPRPGIPAARNKCLSLLQPDDDALVFVDDDETVDPCWLEELTACAGLFDADVVGGPVVSILPNDAPRWLLRGRYFQHTVRPTGSTKGIPATNNVLIRRPVIDRHSLRFDSRYTNSGGSDSDYFIRLQAAGVGWVWCAEAVVREHVQTERVNRRWLFWRYVRGGEVYTRLPLQRTKKTYLCEAAILAAAGVALVPVSALRPQVRRNNLVLLARSFGIVRGLAGRSTNEYLLSRHPSGDGKR